MINRDKVLVAIVNTDADFRIAHEKHWYRIPISSQEKWLKDHWPPQWLALYQTKLFGEEAYSVRYFARVKGIQPAYRWQLFPDEPRDPNANKRYFQLFLEPFQRLAAPIFSRRRRRIVFIPTTWQKFKSSAEINDLYHESSLEDRLWAELKRLKIEAERQELVSIEKRNYFLDFAIYCAKGNLDIETDGDEWHANPEKSALDNLRDNDLESKGWHQLRFSSNQIQEKMSEYCVPQIVKTIDHLGGVKEEGKLLPRRISLNSSNPTYQLGLFD